MMGGRGPMEDQVSQYTVVLYPDAEESAYTVLVPLLPGCVTQGRTIEEALERASEAIQGHLAALADQGEDVPLEDVPPIVTTVQLPEAVAR